jgi:hypothetical protein
MTTITIQFARPRNSRLALLAMSVGVSLVIWAEDHAKRAVSHDDQLLRVRTARDIQAREHAALRLVSPR